MGYIHLVQYNTEKELSRGKTSVGVAFALATILYIYMQDDILRAN